MCVDIWSDVICPWCYVGQARFEKALSTFAHRDEVEVVYHAFELDPSYPSDQHETSIAMLSRKYGMSEADARAADSRVGELLNALHQAYFAQARQVFDRDVISQIAAGAGLDAAAVGELLDGDTFADEVREDEAQAGQLGISGVPFFVFDMALGVSGAQPTQVLTSALDQVWAAAANVAR